MKFLDSLIIIVIQIHFHITEAMAGSGQCVDGGGTAPTGTPPVGESTTEGPTTSPG